MKEKIERFMIGRYGIDQLSGGLNTLFLILMLISLISQNSIFLYLALIPLFYNYYRMFSKNFSKRYNENRIYTNFMSPVYNMEEKLKNKKRDIPNYKYFHCKKCCQELRIP